MIHLLISGSARRAFADWDEWLWMRTKIIKAHGTFAKVYDALIVSNSKSTSCNVNIKILSCTFQEKFLPKVHDLSWHAMHIWMALSNAFECPLIKSSSRLVELRENGKKDNYKLSHMVKQCLLAVFHYVNGEWSVAMNMV